ncbi:MAG: STAS domain-containing protein [Candidatus Eremiobacteraeota bacterium]|nr:STAS domain-containing protein [Candidatus Eremiobacteraeota bacterium]
MGIVSNMKEISAKVALIEVEGDIDFSISQKLKEELIGLVNRGKSKLIIDLSKVRYIDSSGLEALTSTQSKARFHQGDVYLICSDMNIRKIFDITGLDEYIKIFETREKAVEQVGEK